jgi:transcriptional regulator with XRE-family HTH domain
MSLQTNLKQLMFRHGNFSVTELAQKTHLPQPTLHQLYSGVTKRPRQHTLKVLANFFNITVDQLCGFVSLPEQWSSTLKTQLNLHTTPLITWNDLPLLNPMRQMNHLQNIPELILESNPKSPTFALILPDSSMEPLFPRNAILIFNMTKAPSDRDHVLVYLAKQNTYAFKYLLMDGIHHYVKSLNPDLQDTPLYALQKKDHIVGVLLEARIRF